MSDSVPEAEHDPKEPKKGFTMGKLVVLMAVAALFAGLYYFYGDALNFENLSKHETELKRLRDENPALVYGGAFLLYVTVTAFSLPGAAVMTLAIGWYFGFARGLVLVSFASTIGATLAFLLSRYLLRDSIQAQFGDKLVAFNEALERDGAFYLFNLRLIPVVPFFVINVVMGLTPIRVWTYYWVSQIGMLAGTAVFVYAGSTISLEELAKDGYSNPEMLVAFTLLGIFPLIVKGIMAKVRGQKSSDGEAQS
ncbi:MAG: TVP38/TMEM64 family protein [Planctomycetaceae bacterium]|nr:TVP38/TMEM64 family protein [Planctomycetaceae bacterium]